VLDEMSNALLDVISRKDQQCTGAMWASGMSGHPVHYDLHQIASIRSTGRRDAAASPGPIVTSWAHGLERATDLRQRDPLHIRTEIAGPNELDIGMQSGNVVAHRALGHHDDARRTALADIADHRRSRAGEVGLGDDFGRAFRMSQDNDARVLLPERTDFGRVEALVHLAVAGPGNDLDACIGRDILCEVFIGQHDHAAGAEGLDDVSDIARGAADVGLACVYPRPICGVIRVDL
jgi:hypothetical protein